jgi:hypothetical protein
MNWVKVKDTSGNVSNNDTFGTFNYAAASATSGTASLPTKYKLSAPTTSLTAQTFTAATCSSGIMTVANGGGDNAVMYLTTTGGAVVNTAATAGGEFIFGLPQNTITAATFAGTYSGLLYQGGQSSGKVKPVKVTLTASGATLSGTGTELSDPITDTVKAGGGTATLSLTTMNSPSTGFMTGTLTTGSSATLVCVGVANANGSGKQMIDCVSIDSSNGTSLSNFMLVSR